MPRNIVRDRPVPALRGAVVDRSVPEIVVLAAGLILLGLLCYTVQTIISPFVVTGGLVYLLYPFRRLPLARRLMWLAAILFFLWFIYSILGILAPFLIAFLIAYIINPLVTRLEGRGFPRWASSALAVLILIGAAISVVLFVMPPAIQQFQAILSGLASIVNDFVDLLRSGVIFRYLERFGISVDKAQQVITQEISPRLESILKTLLEAVFGFVSGMSTLVLGIVNIVIVPFLVFYLLKDFPVITHRFTMFVPKSRRDRFIDLGAKVDQLMGRYFRGAITVAIIQGIISTLGLWIIGVEYPLVLGIMSGILDFIPYVGLLTSLIVSGIVALFSGGPILTKVVAVVILYLCQKLLEATVLGPKIIGHEVGLHPVLLILCLLVFGYFLGFIGLLIAVPTTSLIIEAVKELERTRKAGQQFVM